MAFGFGKKSRRKRAPNLLENDLEARIKLMDASSENEQLEKLEQKVESLSLICRALWSFVQENQGISQEDFNKRVQSLKHETGKKCPGCGRVMSRTHNRCLYCGNEGGPPNILDTLF